MGRQAVHKIELNDVEQEMLESIVKKGYESARVIQRAQSLLWSAKGKSDKAIADLLGIHPVTVSATRQRWVEENRLTDKQRRGRPTKMDGKQEAFLVALACSDAPEGRESWTMQLLADELVELQIVDAPISDETIRRTLKKMN